jgi:hypothetical protein
MVIVLDDGDIGETVWLNELLPQAFGPRSLDAAAITNEVGSMPRRDDHGG